MHVDMTERCTTSRENIQGISHIHNPHQTSENLERPQLGSPGSPMTRCATAFSEQREATSIQDFPEELRAHALATPEHYHEIILRAYNKPPRRLQACPLQSPVRLQPRREPTVASGLRRCRYSYLRGWSFLDQQGREWCLPNQVLRPPAQEFPHTPARSLPKCSGYN